MFDFAEKTKDMSATEILNYYRNLYYAEPQVTERGIVANAINDYFADDVSKSEVAWEIVKDLRKSLKPYRTEYARTEPVTIENLHCSPIGVRYVIPSYELEAVIHLIIEKYTEDK